MLNQCQSLSHSRWDCKYHVVFVPKVRRVTLYGKIRSRLGSIFHAPARQKECQIEEGRIIASVSGFDKVKSTNALARRLGGRQRNFNGEKSWARGYSISTVGFDEEQIRLKFARGKTRTAAVSLRD